MSPGKLNRNLKVGFAARPGFSVVPHCVLAGRINLIMIARLIECSGTSRSSGPFHPAAPHFAKIMTGINGISVGM